MGEHPLLNPYCFTLILLIFSPPIGLNPWYIITARLSAFKKASYVPWNDLLSASFTEAGLRAANNLDFIFSSEMLRLSEPLLDKNDIGDGGYSSSLIHLEKRSQWKMNWRIIFLIFLVRIANKIILTLSLCSHDLTANNGFQDVCNSSS